MSTSESTTPPTKRCTKCGVEYPATTEYFHRDKSHKDGLNYWCKLCTRVYNRLYYQTNASFRERQRDYKKDYNARPEVKARKLELAQTPAYKEKQRVSAKIRNQRPEVKEAARLNYYKPHNKERQRVYAKQYNQRPEVKEHLHKKYAKKYAEQKANVVLRAHVPKKHKRPVNGIRWRARKRGLTDNFTITDWQHSLDYFNGCCAVCGRQLNGLFHKPSGDHWIPLNSPDCPGTIPTNIVPLCSGIDGCNNSKADKEPFEWLCLRFGDRVASQIIRRIEAYFQWVSLQGTLSP